MFSNKSVLITGGTGSLGRKLTETILAQWPDVNRLVIYSRDEQKQFQMAQEYPSDSYPQIRFFLGDVRDKERLVRAFQGVDYYFDGGGASYLSPFYSPVIFVGINVQSKKKWSFVKRNSSYIC